MCWTSALSEAQQQTLFSENTASLYIGQASGIYAADPLDPQRIEQAMIFLEAAYLLDANNQSIPEQMLLPRDRIHRRFTVCWSVCSHGLTERSFSKN